jgi:hypothetical protein
VNVIIVVVGEYSGVIGEGRDKSDLSLDAVLFIYFENKIFS